MPCWPVFLTPTRPFLVSLHTQQPTVSSLRLLQNRRVILQVISKIKKNPDSKPRLSLEVNLNASGLFSKERGKDYRPSATFTSA